MTATDGGGGGGGGIVLLSYALDAVAGWLGLNVVHHVVETAWVDVPNRPGVQRFVVVGNNNGPVHSAPIEPIERETSTAGMIPVSLPTRTDGWDSGPGFQQFLGGSLYGPQLPTVTAGMEPVQFPSIMAATPWEVGTYNGLNSQSDGLDLHHVPQSHPANQVFTNYDRRTAPVIAVPETIHRNPGLLPRRVGTYSGTARDLVADDLWNLRRAGAPNVQIQKLLNLIKQIYPQDMQK